MSRDEGLTTSRDEGLTTSRDEGLTTSRVEGLQLAAGQASGAHPPPRTQSIPWRSCGTAPGGRH